MFSQLQIFEEADNRLKDAIKQKDMLLQNIGRSRVHSTIMLGSLENPRPLDEAVADVIFDRLEEILNEAIALLTSHRTAALERCKDELAKLQKELEG